jgi:hypothetical protein
MKGYCVLSKITDLIGCEDLQLHLIDSLGDGCFPFKLAWISGIPQNEFFRNLFSRKPSSPNFQFIRVPETSGGDDAASKHPDIGFNRDLLPSV